MADVPPQSEAPKPEYPGVNLPVVFADGVLSAAWDRGVVKFYFGRNDPDLRASNPGKDTPVMQIVMPVAGFVTMSLFFDRIVSRLVDQKHITPEDLEKLRQIWNPEHAS
jgi:hypothetical protein